MSHRIDHIAVLIPARNEEVLLPLCLKSVLEAGRVLPARIALHVVVAVDCSTDRTFELATTMLPAHSLILLTDAGSAGVARAAAARAALTHYAGNPAHCWLANTDADCRVPQNWLLQQLRLAQRGAEAVAGVVDVEDFSEHQPGVERAFRNTYLIGSDGTHPHVHGANIGLRADAYLRAGGWSDHATGEDHDLWRRIASMNCLRLSVAKLRVMTSGRRIGRAPNGFAGALAACEKAVA